MRMTHVFMSHSLAHARDREGCLQTTLARLVQHGPRMTAFVNVDGDAHRIADLSFFIAAGLQMQRIPAQCAVGAQKTHIDIAEQRAVAHLAQSVEHGLVIIREDEGFPVLPEEFGKRNAEIAARPRIEPY